MLFLAAITLDCSLFSTTLPCSRFSNQVVIVTGTSKGIGLGIAKLFAKEGANLVLIARDETLLKKIAEELPKKGGEAIYLKGDVSSSCDREKMAQENLAHFERIDILCHNAGIYA